MTNEEAAKELERIVSVCQSTQLSIAAMMGANALKGTTSEYERGRADAARECVEWLRGLIDKRRE